MSVNKVILVGRAGKDAELRQTQNGQSVANFSRGAGHPVYF